MPSCHKSHAKKPTKAKKLTKTGLLKMLGGYLLNMGAAHVNEHKRYGGAHLKMNKMGGCMKRKINKKRSAKKTVKKMGGCGKYH